MMSQDVEVTIDGQEVRIAPETFILDAAHKAGIYIPHLCSHPDLPPLEETEGVTRVFQGSKEFVGEPRGTSEEEHQGCRLCVVKVNANPEFIPACSIKVQDGMVIVTDSQDLKEYRQKRLSLILENHPHACLTCAQREGCAREPCSTNVPVDERCCPKLGSCELEKVSDYVGIADYTPRYIPKRTPAIESDPLFNRDYDLCIGCTRCVRACRELRGINALGYTYVDGKRVVGTINGSSLMDAGCMFCGACVEVCPTGALQDKTSTVGKARDEVLVPCRHTCPLGANIPQYIRYLRKEQYSNALGIILERTPFPSVLGRVCFHPCENECRRAEINDAIAICALKRYITESDSTPWEEKMQLQSPTGKKVAIIGAGPSGLTVAYFLRRKGHEVVVFEEDDQIGGLLQTALPDHRLPQRPAVARVGRRPGRSAAFPRRRHVRRAPQT